MDKNLLESARQKGMIISLLIHGLGILFLATVSFNLATRKGDPDGGMLVEFTTSGENRVVDNPSPVEVIPEVIAPVAKKPKMAKKQAVKKKVAKKKSPKTVVPVVLPDKEGPAIVAKDESSLDAQDAPAKPIIDPIESDLEEAFAEVDGQKDGDEETPEHGAEDAQPDYALAASSDDKYSGKGGRKGSATGVLSADAELTPYPGNPQPRYGTYERLKRIQGTVLVDFNVDKSGRVMNARVVKSSGSVGLDQSALKAMRQWKYRVGMVMGRTYRKAVKFSLTGEAKELPYRYKRSARR